MHFIKLQFYKQITASRGKFLSKLKLKLFIHYLQKIWQNIAGRRILIFFMFLESADWILVVNQKPIRIRMCSLDDDHVLCLTPQRYVNMPMSIKVIQHTLRNVVSTKVEEQLRYNVRERYNTNPHGKNNSL